MNDNDMKKLEASMQRIESRCAFNQINQDTAFALITFEKNRAHFIRHTKGMSMVKSYTTIIDILENEYPRLDKSELFWVMFRSGMVQAHHANIIAFLIAILYFLAVLLSSIYIWELHPFIVLITSVINFFVSFFVAFIVASIMGAVVA